MDIPAVALRFDNRSLGISANFTLLHSLKGDPGLKKKIQFLLQKILGFERYLFIFSIFKIHTLKSDKNEGDFNFFLKLLREDSNVLDIGANIGIMTTLLGKTVRKGHVFAFEPVPDNFKTLNKVIGHFGLKNVTTFDLALGDENKKIKMILPVVESVKMQGLSHVLHHEIKDFNEGITLEADQRKLDELDFLQDRKIDAIKIDVENFEYYVFKGGLSLIRKNLPVVYCELWDNENRQKCFNFFRDLNYSIKVLEKDHLAAFDPEIHKTQNFFFIPEGKGI